MFCPLWIIIFYFFFFFKCHWNEIFILSFISPLCSFKRALNGGVLYFFQILTESAFFGCQNRLFGAKLCPGSGTEFKDLVTSPVVFMQEALKILSCFHLLYSRLFFMLSIPTRFLPCDFWPALTVNSHHKRWRAPKCVASPNSTLQIRTAHCIFETSWVLDND